MATLRRAKESTATGSPNEAYLILTRLIDALADDRQVLDADVSVDDGGFVVPEAAASDQANDRAVISGTIEWRS